MSSAAIKAGEAFVKVWANDAEAQKALKSLQSRVKAFADDVSAVGKRVMAVGAVMTAPFVGAMAVFAKTGNELDKMASRTGVAVEELSRLGYAAQQSGASMETVESAVRSLQSTIGNASIGMKRAEQALARVGLSADVLARKSPTEQFHMIATALRGITDPTERAAATMKLLGDSGQKLLPMLDNLDALRAEAEKLGVVISTSQAKAAAELSDAYTRVSATVQTAAVAVGAALAPAIAEAANAAARAMSTFASFAKENQTLIVGAAKIGVTLLGAGAALFAFGKGFALIAGGIGLFSKFASGMKGLQDRITGLGAAERDHAAAVKAQQAAQEEHNAALKKREAALARVEAAEKRAIDTAQAVATAKANLAQAEARLADAAVAASQRRMAADTAYQKMAAANDMAEEARYKLKLARMAQLANPTKQGAQTVAGMEAMAGQAGKDAGVAKTNHDAEVKKLAAANRELQAAKAGVQTATESVARAQDKADASAQRLSADTQALATATDRARDAAGKLNTAGYRLAETTDRVGASMKRASGFVGQFGSAKVMAASGSVAALAGSVQMLAGDSAVGEIAGTVAKIAGLGLAASGAVAGVMALKTAMEGMGKGALVATKAMIALAVALVAFKAGQALNRVISGFDPDQIQKDVKATVRATVDGSKNLLEAQQKILQKIGKLRREEAEQGMDVFGAFRIVNPFGNNQALNAEINALEAELEGVTEEWRAQEKAAKAAKIAADEAAETEKLEANKKAVQDLADAWESVLKKLADVEKNRFDRARDKRFDKDLADDPYSAKDQASGQYAEAKAVEAALGKRLDELEARRRRLVEAAADTETLDSLRKEIEKALQDYERAVETTDVWEKFHDRADDAITKTREALKRLGEDAKKLDLDYTKKQDDERFQGLLKTDWTNAANEVAQAMARVNSEWLSTGQKVAELQAKAESGDIESQRELEKALELRKELAQERNSLEGRQRDVAQTRQEGERSYSSIRDIAAGEARHKAREDFEQAASVNPRASNAALEEFIASLEDQLARSVARGRQAQLAQDYAGASAYEAQAKAVQEQLSELRSMQGQRQERESVTGDFNARAMEAMMRGGGGKAIEQRQLETQQKMADRLGKLVDLYQAPTVAAVD